MQKLGLMGECLSKTNLEMFNDFKCDDGKQSESDVDSPVNYHRVVEELSETSGLKEKGHVQHHIAVP